jgi:hypothetical protein
MVPHFFPIPFDKMVMRMNDVQTAVVIEQGLVAEASVAAESGFDTKQPFTGGDREMRSLRKHNCGSSALLRQLELKSQLLWLIKSVSQDGGPGIKRFR